MQSRSIDDVDKGNRCRSIDNTSYGGGCCSFSDIPFSQSLGDPISDLPDEHVSDTSKGSRSPSIDDIDTGARSHSINNTSKGSGCWLINEVPFSRPLGDHISGLPDDIMFDILSRLALLDVMRAAVLSKRWRNVCSALPYLDLDWSVLTGSSHTFHSKKCEPYRGAYVNNVDQVLRRYKDQDILSLRLSCCLNKEYFSVISRCIDFAATRENLVSLNLQFACLDHLALRNHKVDPDELYTISGTFLSGFSLLKDLYLDSCILKLQGGVRLSKLVTLCLHLVVLEGTQWQCVLSSLSNIQRLQLTRCNLPEKLRFGANLCCLSVLMIDFCRGLLEVELNAENLKSFEYFGNVAVKCSYLCAPKLENLYVLLVEKDRNGGEAMFSNLAPSLPSLRTPFLGGMYSQLHILPTSPAILFRSVSMLELYMNSDDPEADLVQVLPSLLRGFPLLKQLNVMGKPPQPYLHHHLKEIELGSFLPVWSEFARYLLVTTVRLERLVIKKSVRVNVGRGKGYETSDRYSDDERNRIRELLDGVAALYPLLHASSSLINYVCNVYGFFILMSFYCTNSFSDILKRFFYSYWTC